MAKIVSTHRLLGSQSKWMLRVASPWLLAVLLALGNHFFFVSLHNKDSSQYNQFWLTVLKNVWAMIVHALIMSSASTAFAAMVWASFPGRCLPVKAVDSALQLPSLVPALQIISSPSIKFLHQPVYWSACLATLALVTITPPAALSIRPMQPVLTELRVPTLDLSTDPRLYTVTKYNWEYVRPSNHIRRYMRNVLTSDALFAWEAPLACRYGCTYNASYYAPALRCVDYTIGERQSGLELDEVYQGWFNVSNSYLTFNVTAWPISNGTRRIDDVNTAPVGTRCTFHNGTYRTRIIFGRNLQRATVTNHTILTTGLLAGLPLGISNTSYCPSNTSSLISNPLDAPPCARTQLNTWALIDAFASSLSGTILTYRQSLGPKSRFANNALMPNLDYLFSVDELSRSFDLAPWVKERGFGNALESLFANATLALTRDAQAYNWTSVTSEARIIPYMNQYVYEPNQLWFGYGLALVTAFGAGLAGWVARRGGNVPREESALAKVLATTRDRSFDRLEGMGGVELDDVVVRYECVQSGEESRTGFTVVSDWGRPRRSSEVEEIMLLQKS